MTDGSLLEVRDLQVTFVTEDGLLRAVDGVSFALRAGEVLAIVGESGSGKSVTAQTIMGLTRTPNARISGRIDYGGRDLVAATEEELMSIRGKEIAMIFQDPMTSLNPVYTVGNQIVEAIRAHTDEPKHSAKEKAIELLDAVGIPDPRERADNYPHEFSGGMRQRAMIAMALVLEPNVLIADEPSTALDVTIQAQILRLLEQLNRDRDLAVIIITHDLGVVAEIADRVLVMYGGRIVESGSLDQIFYDPQHPYTWGSSTRWPAPTGLEQRGFRRSRGNPPPCSIPRRAATFAPAARMPSTAAPWRNPPCSNVGRPTGRPVTYSMGRGGSDGSAP